MRESTQATSCKALLAIAGALRNDYASYHHLHLIIVLIRLLCAISALAEFPGEIERMFCGRDGTTMQSINETGVYEVRLFKNGQDQLVRLDDYIPCRIGDGPIYARAKGMQCVCDETEYSAQSNYLQRCRALGNAGRKSLCKVLWQL